MITVDKEHAYMTIRVYRDEEANKVYAELVSPEYPIMGVGETSAGAIGHLLQEIGIAFCTGTNKEDITASMFVNL